MNAPAGLARILEHHRARAASDARATERLLDEARGCPRPRDFAAAIRRPGLSVIAEIKRRSPSKGDIAPGLDPVEVASAYAAGGAACLSVLTDEEFFAGSVRDLQVARKSSGLPVLRKDFTVAAVDVCDARIMGADAVLLIVAALDDHELTDLQALATELHLACLVECHDEAEIDRAVGCGAKLVGVNQRDLTTFSVDHDRAAVLAACLPGDVVSIAESGIRDAEDARRAAEAGYDAVLVGEALVRSADSASLVRQFIDAGRPAVGSTP